MAHRTQEHCLGVIRVLGHHACIASLRQRSRGSDAKSYAIESLRAVAGHRVGEMPVENGELAWTGKSKCQSTDRMTADIERKKYPRATRGDLADALKRWITDQHLFERFQIDCAAMLYRVVVWTDFPGRRVLERAHKRIERSGFAQEREPLFLLDLDHDRASIASESDNGLAENGIGDAVLRDGVTQCRRDFLQSRQPRSRSIRQRLSRCDFASVSVELLVRGRESRECPAELVSIGFEAQL